MPYVDYNQVLQALADNIRDVNGSTASIRFVDMPDLIGSFISPCISAHNEVSPTLKSKLVPYMGNTSGMTDMQYMFNSIYLDDEPLDLSHFDTSNVTNMSSMFSACRTSSIDLSSFDTSNVTDMSIMFSGFMFYNTDADLDLSYFDTSKVTSMTRMFYRYGSWSYPSGVTFSVTLNVTGWDVSRVTSFVQCFALQNDSLDPSSSLTELDLSGWNTSSATDMHGMFGNSQLRKIWVPSTFVATGCSSVQSDYAKPFSVGASVTCHIYTDASSASQQGWGTIHSSYVVHYNSTHTDYENA